MPKKITKNLNLFTIRLPMPALVSILHRMSGAVLFIFMPFVVVAFCNSLTSASFYERTISQLFSFPFVLIFYLMVWGAHPSSNCWIQAFAFRHANWK